MGENFEVAKSSSEDELSETARHEVVAAQLRGEAKAAGEGPDAVVAAVAEELETIGLEPDPSELHRRYEEIDPDLPELGDSDTGSDTGSEAGSEAGTEAGSAGGAGAQDAPADAGNATSAAGADGPVTAGLDAGRDRSAVDSDGDGDVAQR